MIPKQRTNRDGRWTQDEHDLFLRGMKIHGRRWTKVAEIVGTRTTVQVRSHAQKYEMKIGKEKKTTRNSRSDSCETLPGSPMRSSSISEENLTSDNPPCPPGHQVDTEDVLHQVTMPDASDGLYQCLGSKPLVSGHELDGDEMYHQVSTPDILGGSIYQYSHRDRKASQNIGLALDTDTEITEWAKELVRSTEPYAMEDNTVNDMMRFKPAPWYETLTPVMRQDLTHDLTNDDVMMTLDGLLEDTSTSAQSVRLQAQSSEDEIMLYLDSSSFDHGSTNEDLIRMGASDLMNPSLFPSFPSNDHGCSSYDF
mmetsp:Transcript_4144/g.4857  ORF Transcript_4144/g.4857 Transcript_4144/m.4857 type:complete len:310 (-) Transcript_4144:613-1542(-)|eukprot:CAMPEP_0185775260 /NCGR_PEP_ID=MMETSP1174-20130828/81456_1 /TAXON_ID=35687 /ORGANISM="Dictyocha speculum, Strain CCMP1381" /LENGTH=309 /DNA_ID=CAMNT_0028462773 /DNA_START=205 /DNA_END=1134 /DNA_ORIENTATION=-